jgi:hypothetical protein
MRRIVRIPLLALGLVACGAPASAQAAGWRVTVLFRGSYAVAQRSPSGTLVSSLTARASLTGTWDVSIGATDRAVAAYPAPGTVRYELDASGTRLMCGSERHFADRVHGQPGLAWFTLAGSGPLLPFTYSWSGDRIDRVWDDPAGDDDCGLPAGVEEGAGAGDLPGTSALAAALGLDFRLPASGFVRSRTTSRVYHLQRSFRRGGTTRTLRGLWSVVFRPHG